LKASEEKVRKDYDEAQTKLNALIEEKTQLLTAKKTLEEQIENLNSQLTQLTTHSNHKQKIRHHIKVKQDYDNLRKINETLTHELRRKELLVQRLTSELRERQHQLFQKFQIKPQVFENSENTILNSVGLTILGSK
jgi:predicted nuclease with TOPRIM domain